MPTSKNKKMTFASAEATRAWGKRFAAKLKPGDVIALIGELGSGKTTLVQGVAAGWGYTRKAVSPTFALVNEYHSPRGALFHMDSYRMSPSELAAFPLEEYLAEPAVCLIEWADRLRERWPDGTLELQLKPLGPISRELTVVAPSPRWHSRLTSL
jgi:tRNA threonylcarbamoyladenosine biosynthesis protein TsaE